MAQEKRAALVRVTYDIRYVPAELLTDLAEAELDNDISLLTENILFNQDFMGSDKLPPALRPLHGNVECVRHHIDWLPSIDEREMLQSLNSSAPNGTVYTQAYFFCSEE